MSSPAWNSPRVITVCTQFYFLSVLGLPLWHSARLYSVISRRLFTYLPINIHPVSLCTYFQYLIKVHCTVHSWPLWLQALCERIFFSLVQEPKSDLYRLIVEVSRSSTIRHRHTTRGTPLNQWSARRRCRYLYNTQQTQEKHILTLDGIRTSDSSNWLED